MKALVLIVVSIALSAAGQLLLRSGARAAPPLDGAAMWDPNIWISLLLSWQIAAGVLSWALSTLVWIAVLNRTELSYAYALYALNYVLVPLLSRWLLDERLPTTRVIGMGFIFTGVLITWLGRSLRH